MGTVDPRRERERDSRIDLFNNTDSFRNEKVIVFMSELLNYSLNQFIQKHAYNALLFMCIRNNLQTGIKDGFT